MTEWNAIKKEYITDETTSYAKLSKKYGISKTMICKKSTAEGWVNERERYLKKCLSKSLEASSKKEASRITRLSNVADKLLDRIEAIIINDSEKLTPAIIDCLANSLKKIKDVQGAKSDIDIREQNARIKNLEKQVEADNNVPEVVITFGGDAKEYAE